MWAKDGAASALDRAPVRVLAIVAAITLAVVWWRGDALLHATEPSAGAWLLAPILVVLALAGFWVWSAVFRGRRDGDGMSVSIVALLVCVAGAVVFGTAGLVLELFVRATRDDTVARIVLRVLWHAACALGVLFVSLPVTLRALGSLRPRPNPETGHVAGPREGRS